jgi:Domain of unknown function (DUF4349)
MTHPDDTTATIERDLRAVDDALDDGAAAHEDPLARELQELALALRADAPEADPVFVQRLRGTVAGGFPGRRRAPRLTRMLPATAAVATVVGIGLAIAYVDIDGGTDYGDGGDGGGGAEIVRGGDDDGAVAGGGGGGGGAAAPEADRSAKDALGSTSGALAAEPRSRPGGGFAPGRRDRKIERSISMTLEAPDEKIPELASDVTEVTNRHGGFVLSSNLNTDDEGATGFFELRIPSSRLREALADLAGLATVRSQSQSGQDVTREYVTSRDRLDAARAERRSLLRRLGVAATDEEAEAIRRRLDIVAGEINGLRAQLRNLHLRTDYAVVTVDLAGGGDDSGGGGASGSFDDAVGDAGDLVVGLAGVLIRVLALAIPLGLIALLGWLAGSSFRRRRRESVLA